MNEALSRTSRLFIIFVATLVGSWAVWSLTADAQNLGEGLLRPVEAPPIGLFATGATGTLRIQQTMVLNAATLTATSATTKKYINAVRLSCSSTCFVAVSASNGASMANFISGAILGGERTATSTVYRSTGGDYVIGIAEGTAIVYIQELTR